jgi:hypothetical protein
MKSSLLCPAQQKLFGFSDRLNSRRKMPIENMEEEGLAKASSPRKSFIFLSGTFTQCYAAS